MPVRFLLSTLKNGVKPEDYERWVREYDYKMVATFENYVGYRVHRIEGTILGAENATWQYIERIEVKSLEQHDKDLASPAGEEMRRQLYGEYLDRSKNVYFTTEPIL
jgi:hypothetical protein